MDYEKMYKAALKTATQWIKDGCSDKEKICLESIFPELRESEDERIRKFLVDYFASYKIGNVATKLNGVRIDDILAYLEKQKEKLEDISTVLLIKKEIERRIETWQESRKKFIAMECNTLADDAVVRIEELHSLISFLGIIRCNLTEKQKESLHIQETGKENANSFTDDVIEVRSFQRGMEEGRKLEKQKEQKPVVTHGETYHVDTLGTQQVIAGKMPQKPAEWSEKHIADIFEKVGLAKIVREQGNDELTNALQDAMLELSKVENAEWSEEDEWKRKELIQYLEEKGDYRTVWMTWLKSLRPSWKPSEEQMEALEYVIRDYREDSCNATANYLQEILDHLKNM